MDTDVVAAQLEAMVGKTEHRFIIGDAQAFHRVQGLAASHAKDHVRLLVQGQSPQALHGGIGAVFHVDFSADNFQIRLSHVSRDFVIGGSQGLAPPDNQHFFAIGLAHRADFLVDLVADGVAGQMDLVIFQFHFDTSFRDKATKNALVPTKLMQGQERNTPAVPPGLTRFPRPLTHTNGLYALFDNGVRSPACLLEETYPLSARPRKPIHPSFCCRTLTHGGSLKAAALKLLALSQRFALLYHKKEIKSIEILPV